MVYTCFFSQILIYTAETSGILQWLTFILR
uniref:Macaca fascicularis brain cDNA, clone: QbsA-11216 n=1 Tax=Macaca fascicularis TaxID=9541 RepID=I7GHP7_MACFA|nr:unnamed protein product [Macaca fascicularis]